MLKLRERKIKKKYYIDCLFKIKYNNGLQLFTIRHYQEGIEHDFIKDKIIFVEQKSRSTYQIVLQSKM